MKSRLPVFLAVAFAILGVSSARGGAWLETGDAGDLPATAQGTTGSGSLNTITGLLWWNPYDPPYPQWDVDLYCIRISDEANFTAFLSPAPGQTEQAPLYLFDAMGFGVTMQEGFYNGGTASMITSLFVPSNGQYYIGIGTHDAWASDAGGTELWAHPPNESQPVNNNPLAQWIGSGSPFYYPAGMYIINLTGAQFGNCGASVPAERWSWGQIKSTYRSAAR